MYTFSLKINDEKNTLNEYNGMSIVDLGKMLVNLSKALPLKGKDSTLYEINGNCYQQKIATEERITHDVFVEMMLNISNGVSMPVYQKPFHKSIENIIKNGFFCEAFDTEEKLIAKISSTNEVKKGFKYSTETIYGTITEIGGKSLERLHIVIFSQNDSSIFNIPITKEQDDQLKNFYKNGILKFEVQFRYDSVYKRKLPFQLLSFKQKSSKSFFQLVDDFTDLHGDIIKGTNAVEQIIENRRLNSFMYE